MIKSAPAFMKKFSPLCLRALFRVCSLLLFFSGSILPASAQTFTRWEPASGGNGHYYALTPAASNWAQAEAYAVALGGHLVCITSAAEQAFIENTFLTGTFALSPLWIGLSDSVVENTFVWSTGEPVTFTRWHVSQPDNGSGGEDFGTINWHRAQNPGAAFATWNDAPVDGTTAQGGNSSGPYFGIIELFNGAGGPADGDLLVNGSFENTQGTFINNGQSFMNVAPNATTVPGWTVIKHTGSWIQSPNGFSLSAADGSMFWDLTGTEDSTNLAGVSQTIATIPGESYRLSFSVGSDGTAAPFGGTKTVRATAPGVSRSFVFTAASPGSQWMSFEMPFTATSYSSTITITGTDSGLGNHYLGLDHASVTAVVTPPMARIFPGPATGTVFFAWPVTEAGSYQVQRSTQMDSWLSAGNPVFPAGAGTFGNLFNVGANGKEFFRVVKLP